MPKKVLPITLLIVIFTASLAAAALYIKNKVVQSQKESTISPSLEPEEIAPEIIPTKPSEIDTSDWKIYRNKEYRFHIKYSENWQIAYFIMEWYTKNDAHPYYTPNIAGWIMITNLTREEENEYL